MSNEIRQICVISVFPEIVNNFIQYGVLKRGQEKALINIESINLRDFSDKNGYVDDKPYGGGAGMVLQAKPLIDATRYAKSKLKNSKCIYLSPKGKKVDQALITDTANNDNLIIIAGRYEGVDQRFIDLEVDEEWSIGDYILSGGEVAACVLIDAIARMIPGVLGHEDSNKDESFSNGYLEYPHYTRPEIVENISAPEVLLSGNHEEIKKWREKQALLVTNDKRSDLIKKKLS
ncbi:tRNA (guanosine(37)-N1)-methyltransferase TrmD [Gammaproteobacteria bacterium]|nr:tRNA (guanosine(37)-N1)-methyltransferase TrmD [Gammaproteobacteria bacterium]|tara:strand:+ start:201 stop:899 length:699 start_codon:yes stop_codon:yes gene_type:complete